ncbi:MAG: YqaJ viral recombinase family protein [Vicinamibacterales bacterium]|jgi:predicted phage-related endonuclease|nr:YqaJ viral recombinase family protein [Vicinamibacterales bacterium]MDP7477651.1 YqaJ viral recombinase family protein [Vicinamibacterales bacterium]
MSYPFIEHTMDQRSEAWFKVRLGKVTSSRATPMLSAVKKGEAAGRRNLRAALVQERATGVSADGDYVSKAMQDGIDREAAALAAYESLTGRLVEPSGFIQHPELPAGASLDGQVDDYHGIVEAKAPLFATHTKYLLTGKVPYDYLCQVTHALYISGAEWCDWFSYQPDFIGELEGGRVKLVRVMRADVDLVEHDKKLRAFLAEVDTELQALRTLIQGMAVAV